MLNFYKVTTFVFLFPLYLSGQNSEALSIVQEVGVVEKLDTYLPEDIYVVRESGDTVLLHTLIDKPTVLAFVYFRCPGVCSPLMDGLADVIQRNGLLINTDYQVFTIGFDPREDIELARRKKSNYMNLVNVAGAKEGWQFFTTDSTNSKKLTNAAGFYYKKSGNDFLHSATLVFIDPHKKITRYLNGTRFLPFEFKMALLETSQGRTGPTINKVLQYCYSFEPKGQQYVLNITRVSGVLIMFILFITFLILTLKPIIKKIRNNKLQSSL